MLWQKYIIIWNFNSNLGILSYLRACMLVTKVTESKRKTLFWQLPLSSTCSTLAQKITIVNPNKWQRGRSKIPDLLQFYFCLKQRNKNSVPRKKFDISFPLETWLKLKRIFKTTQLVQWLDSDFYQLAENIMGTSWPTRSGGSLYSPDIHMPHTEEPTVKSAYSLLWGNHVPMNCLPK